MESNPMEVLEVENRVDLLEKMLGDGSKDVVNCNVFFLIV